MQEPTLSDSDLQPHQKELIQLAQLAGIYASPEIFRIIIEMLNMKIEPKVIFHLLKHIRRSAKHAGKSSSLMSSTK